MKTKHVLFLALLTLGTGACDGGEAPPAAANGPMTAPARAWRQQLQRGATAELARQQQMLQALQMLQAMRSMGAGQQGSPADAWLPPGDHFWSSRLGAGNYDPQSGQGYVSVPGHGPIGFGF